MPPPIPLIERLERNRLVDPVTGCWEWQGAKTAGGYGLMRWHGGRTAHRAAYITYVGPIPDGLTLDHLCRNPGCVNPAHLEPVTMRENTMRGTSFSAVNAQKTHCPEGHPLSGDNLLSGALARGERRCRICGARNNRNYRARQPKPPEIRGCCDQCGAEYVMKRKDARFCGRVCSRAYWNRYAPSRVSRKAAA